ncbi:MAG TPA: hypothetical protein VK866_13970 [Acidimicrobiales bacterium]|nr:hypothetical protein [Acidimicrobiales bacterium]
MVAVVGVGCGDSDRTECVSEFGAELCVTVRDSGTEISGRGFAPGTDALVAAQSPLLGEVAPGAPVFVTDDGTFGLTTALLSSIGAARPPAEVRVEGTTAAGEDVQLTVTIAE